MQKLSALKEELEQRGSLNAELEKVLSFFYKKMEEDTMIGFFFKNKDIKHVIEQQKKLLLMVLGVEKYYDGRPVNQAHHGLPDILPGHFDRRLILLKETLTENNFSQLAQDQWVGFENQFRNVIVK